MYRALLALRRYLYPPYAPKHGQCMHDCCNQLLKPPTAVAVQPLVRWKVRLIAKDVRARPTLCGILATVPFKISYLSSVRCSSKCAVGCLCAVCAVVIAYELRLSPLALIPIPQESDYQHAIEDFISRAFPKNHPVSSISLFPPRYFFNTAQLQVLLSSCCSSVFPPALHGGDVPDLLYSRCSASGDTVVSSNRGVLGESAPSHPH